MASPSLSAEHSPRRLLSVPRNLLFRLAEQIRETLARTLYTPPAGSPVSVKSLLESLLPQNASPKSVDREIKDFCLCCAALASAEGVESPSVYWIPKDLSSFAKSALREISAAGYFAAEHEMVAELMAEVLPELKAVVKETCVDPDEEVFVAGSVRAPVVNSIVAAHQFRWLVTQVIYPHLGNLCALVMPCALTTLDHWSPEVKEQGMLALFHLGKNVNATELGWYEEAFLDVCCRNIATSDDLWSRIIEVLERIHSIIKLTWVRKSPYMPRLLDELIHLYKEVETRKNRESIRNFILDSLILLQKCKGMQFETSWIKYKDDPGLENLVYSLSEALKSPSCPTLAI